MITRTAISMSKSNPPEVFYESQLHEYVMRSTLKNGMPWSKYNGPFTFVSASWNETIEYSTKYVED